jgi:hypothetical protein
LLAELPQTEPFVLAGANHALEKRNPRGAAEAIAPFLARHPMTCPPEPQGRFLLPPAEGKGIPSPLVPRGGLA